jgi:hypothetical protein
MLYKATQGWTAVMGERERVIGEGMGGKGRGEGGL